ncbi:MAG: rubredoxin [Cetobacterium sp.]
MEKWRCNVCNWIYDAENGDPENGIAPETPWEDVPEDWVCPICGVGKDEFEQE